MKIKRFFENEVQGPIGNVDLVNDISTSRVEEIIKDMKSFMDAFDKNLNELVKIQKELSKYKNSSKNKNTQIDDSVTELQLVTKSLEETVLAKIDTVINQLEDYTDNGLRYIYSE
jgi:ABC-type transporter Mla subunit MlaD